MKWIFILILSILFTFFTGCIYQPLIGSCDGTSGSSSSILGQLSASSCSDCREKGLGCCNGKCYNATTTICCEGTIYQKFGTSDEVYACCGNGVMIEQIRTPLSSTLVEFCCNGKPYKYLEKSCCDGEILPGSGRCNGQVICKEGETACGSSCCSKGLGCCGGSCYDPSSSRCQRWY